MFAYFISFINAAEVNSSLVVIFVGFYFIYKITFFSVKKTVYLQ